MYSLAPVHTIKREEIHQCAILATQHLQGVLDALFQEQFPPNEKGIELKCPDFENCAPLIERIMGDIRNYTAGLQ